MTIPALSLRSAAATINEKSLVGDQARWRDGSLLLAIVALIALTEYVFAYWNVAYGIGMALLLALGLALFTTFAPISAGLGRCIDSLTLLPLYVLFTSSLPWFLLDQQVLLPAVYYCILVLCFRHLRARGNPIELLRTLGLKLDGAGRYALLGLAIGLPTGAVEFAILTPAPDAPTLLMTHLLRDVVYMVFFVGFAEELLFRAIIQRDAVAVLGWKGGLFLSSLLFGIMHMTWRSVPELGFTFLAGLVLGYIYYRTKSLVAPILIHAVNNVMLVTIMPHILGIGR